MIQRTRIADGSPRLTDRHGTSLVVVTMMALVVSLMIGGFATYVNNRIRARVIDDFKKNREIAYQTILQTARDPNAFLVSAKYSSVLNQCIKNPDSCVAKNESQRRRFSLYLQLTDRSVQLTALKDDVIAGMFDRFGGKNCNSNMNCAMIGKAEFWLECTPGMTCYDGGFIKVRVEVEKNPAWKPPGASEATIAKTIAGMNLGIRASGGQTVGGRVLPDEDASVSVTALRRLLRDKALQRCPEGAWLVKLDEKGHAKCKCGGFYREISANPLTCELIDKCVPVVINGRTIETIFVGMEPVQDSDGLTVMQPRCALANDFLDTCQPFTTPPGSEVKVVCPNNGFMIKAKPTGECTVKASLKAELVTCPSWDITCCNLK